MLWRLWWLHEHLSDPDAPADPRITGALMASLICSVIYSWEFWSKSYNLLMEAIRWLMSDDKVVLGVLVALM